jgi:phage repressor protein C with HTH and peptisase S24 domain
MGFNEAAQADHFDPSGYPIGTGWDVALVPGVAEEGAFVLEISGHQLAPIYRDGDRLVVSPSLEARRGDRVVVKTRSGDMRVMQLAQRSAQRLVLAALNPDQPGLTVDLSELVWMSRIVWASQ